MPSKITKIFFVQDSFVVWSFVAVFLGALGCKYFGGVLLKFGLLQEEEEDAEDQDEDEVLLAGEIKQLLLGGVVIGFGSETLEGLAVEAELAPLIWLLYNESLVVWHLVEEQGDVPSGTSPSSRTDPLKSMINSSPEFTFKVYSCLLLILSSSGA